MQIAQIAPLTEAIPPKLYGKVPTTFAANSPMPEQTLARLSPD